MSGNSNIWGFTEEEDANDTAYFYGAAGTFSSSVSVPINSLAGIINTRSSSSSADNSSIGFGSSIPDLRGPLPGQQLRSWPMPRASSLNFPSSSPSGSAKPALNYAAVASRAVTEEDIEAARLEAAKQEQILRNKESEHQRTFQARIQPSAPLCHFFPLGTCKHGQNCRYVHAYDHDAAAAAGLDGWAPPQPHPPTHTRDGGRGSGSGSGSGGEAASEAIGTGGDAGGVRADTRVGVGVEAAAGGGLGGRARTGQAWSRLGGGHPGGGSRESGVGAGAGAGAGAGEGEGEASGYGYATTGPASSPSSSSSASPQFSSHHRSQETTAAGSDARYGHGDSGDYGEARQCGICMGDPKDSLYGVLSHCNCVFCLGCIREWRAEGQARNPSMAVNTLRQCPLCRVPSYYVVPSTRSFSLKGAPAMTAASGGGSADGAAISGITGTGTGTGTGTAVGGTGDAAWAAGERGLSFSERQLQVQSEKQVFIDAYKQSLASRPCRNYLRDKKCPFGSSCFYLHIDSKGEVERDARQALDASTKPRYLLNADGETVVLQGRGKDGFGNIF
jgi:hypothetical protein